MANADVFVIMGGGRSVLSGVKMAKKLAGVISAQERGDGGVIGD